MSFAGKKPGSCIQANPASTGQVHLAPGVQVGEIDFGAGWAIEAFHVGGQLDQVTGNETRRQPEVAQ
ncbi:hypothetical protein D3C86_1746160 [compost metagenome]